MYYSLIVQYQSWFSCRSSNHHLSMSTFAAMGSSLELSGFRSLMAGAPKRIAGIWKEGVGWKPLQICLINRTGVWLDDMKNIQNDCISLHSGRANDLGAEPTWLAARTMSFWLHMGDVFCWCQGHEGYRQTCLNRPFFWKCILQTNVWKKNAEDLHLHNCVKGFVRLSNSQFSKCCTTSTNEVKDNQKLMWNSDLFLAPLISEYQYRLGPWCWSHCSQDSERSLSWRMLAEISKNEWWRKLLHTLF